MNTTHKDRLVGQFADNTYDLSDREQRMEFAKQKWNKYICSFASRHRNAVSGYDDFLQEAEFIILKAVDGWDPNKSEARFETYVYSSLHHSLIDLSVRTQQGVTIPSGSLKQKEASVKTVKVSEELPDSRIYSSEYLDIVDTIQSFDHYRIAEMYFVEEMTLEEIAATIGESRSTVHRRLIGIQDRLQKKLNV